jgi:SAM-dependent methyltransferase
MSLDADSLERLVPDQIVREEVTGQETLRLHLARYEFAAAQARGGRILDLACGVGYGTRLLADRAQGAREVVGVDLSAQAVEFATRRYGGERVRFVCSDAVSFQDAGGFDTAVSLETIEHVEDPRALVERLVALLRPGGVLIASVPTTPSVDFNPHHRHDFSARSFRALLASFGLRERGAFEQVQPVNPLAILRKTEARMKEARPHLLRWYARHPGALGRRVAATVRHGFCNRYLTLALEKPHAPAGDGR